MRIAIAATLVVLGLALSAGPASAGEMLDSYCARLGTDDHFNSNGARLDNVAAIIRQDRANFHAFRIRDADDEGDGFFASKENRARLESMLRRGTVTKAAQRAIVNGTPYICVDIYADFVNVTLQ